MEFPTTILEFEERFATERDCEDYLFELRWPNGFECPRCGAEGGWRLRSRPRLIQCCSCRKQTSVTAGTALHKTRKPLRAWFRAMFLLSTQKNGTNAMNLKRQLGVCYETAWSWLHKLRGSMYPDESKKTKLKGAVDVDEAYVGGLEPGCPGRGSRKKAVVAVGVEDLGGRIGRVRLSTLLDASGRELGGFVASNVAAGSTTRTDGWGGFSKISQHGVEHEVIKSTGSRSAGVNNFPLVHLVISLLKRWLLGTYQGAVTRRHLPSYLDEFMFRFNRRRCQHATGIFERLAKATIKAPRRTLAQIVDAARVMRSLLAG